MKHKPLEMAAKWFGMTLKSILMTVWYLLECIGNAMQVFKRNDGDQK